MSETPPSSDATRTDSEPTAADPPIRLVGAQRRLADAYDAADAGLFTLDCVPGAGKSVVRTHLAATELLQRWAAGDRTPAQHLCVITFSRAEAASITDEIIARIRGLVAHDRTPAAANCTEADVAALTHRVRAAPSIGTIDSVIRSVFSDLAGALGFDEVPAIGDDAQLTRLHEACYAAVETGHGAAVERLTDAYPDEPHDASLAALLRTALRYCRRQQLTTDAFATRLRDSVAAVYDGAPPDSAADILADITRCVAPDAADAAETALERDAVDTDAVVAADAALHTRWHARIDDFTTVLAAYRDAYRRLARERGVLSHLDCAFLVAETAGDATTTAVPPSNTPRSRRALARHRDRIDTWLLDEAQDLSAIQHAALAPFVTTTDTVFAAGDIRQSIYEWRGAAPDQWHDAVTDGEFLGHDWAHHVTETATRTYRCRPDIAAAVTALTGSVLPDPERGSLGNRPIPYPGLDAARDATPAPSVHVAAFTPHGPPGTAPYVTPDDGKGEADITATYVACGLADDTLTPDTASDADGPPVTVLLRRRTHMDAYADAFDDAGLTVATPTAPLLEHPAVELIRAVLAWLAAPTAAHTEPLLTDAIGIDALTDTASVHGWALDAAADSDTLTDTAAAVLEALRTLRDTISVAVPRAAPALIDHITTELRLHSDAYGLCPDTTAEHRVRTLDAFEAWLNTTITSDVTPATLADRLTALEDAPGDGPLQPSQRRCDADVELKTIHEMKGDEAPVIVLADLGITPSFPPAADQRLLTTTDTAALAPPAADPPTPTPSLGPFPGLYTPDADAPTTNAGLRWATSEWRADDDGLVGHDLLQRAPAARHAESWRVLYVALTRACDHLVLPLPRSDPGGADARDRWLETITDGLDFDGLPDDGDTYTITVPDAVGDADADSRRLTIGVNDVTYAPSTPTPDTDSPAAPGAAAPLHAGVAPSDATALPSYCPRMLRPSTLAPLLDAPTDHLLTHLRGTDLHTDADAPIAALPFDPSVVPPRTVGDIAHAVLTTLSTHVATTLHPPRTDTVLAALATPSLDAHLQQLPDAARSGVRRFILETVLPQFHRSACYEKLQRATRVYTEKPLPGRLRVDGVEHEFDGHADVVVTYPDGSWDIIEFKLAFRPMAPELYERYQLQVATYANLLRQYVTTPVRTSIEVFGRTVR